VAALPVNAWFIQSRPDAGGCCLAGVRIERFDPAGDQAAGHALYDVYANGAPIDDPAAPAMSFRVFGGWLAHGWTAQPRETWLASGTAGHAVGGYVLGLPDRENRDQGGLDILVAPARRRSGLGTALLRHAAERARTRGRSFLVADTRDGSAGEAFVRWAGASPGQAEIRRIQDLAALAPGQLASLRATADAAAAGYSVLDWEGPSPAEYLDQLAALNEAMGDAPRGPGEEAQRWDAERVRGTDQRVAAQGLRYYSVVVRDDVSGQLAGLTQLGVDPVQPERGQQELTAVARPHRGHRLGLLLKLAMLELLAEREPQLRWILTGNAQTNRHMIAINEALGYRVLDQWTEGWRLPVDRAAALRPAQRAGRLS
jgi:GNAT superfamily N-acetyltransferase